MVRRGGKGGVGSFREGTKEGCEVRCVYGFDGGERYRRGWVEGDIGEEQEGWGR